MYSVVGPYGLPVRPIGRPIGRDPTLDDIAGPTPATTGVLAAGCERSGRSGVRVDVVSDGWKARPNRRIRTAR